MVTDLTGSFQTALESRDGWSPDKVRSFATAITSSVEGSFIEWERGERWVSVSTEGGTVLVALIGAEFPLAVLEVSAAIAVASSARKHSVMLVAVDDPGCDEFSCELETLVAAFPHSPGLGDVRANCFRLEELRSSVAGDRRRTGGDCPSGPVTDLTRAFETAIEWREQWSDEALLSFVSAVTAAVPGAVLSWDGPGEGWASVMEGEEPSAGMIAWRLPLAFLRADIPPAVVDAARAHSVMLVPVEDLDNDQFRCDVGVLVKAFPDEPGLGGMRANCFNLGELWYAEI